MDKKSDQATKHSQEQCSDADSCDADKAKQVKRDQSQRNPEGLQNDRPQRAPEHGQPQSTGRH